MSGPGASRHAWRDARSVLHTCGFFSGGTVAALVVYAFLTPLNAFLDGMSWVLLVQAVNAAPAAALGPLAALEARIPPGSRLPVVLGLFVFRALTTVLLSSLDGHLQARLRRCIQEKGVSAILAGRWDELRHQHVGRWIGALTEETAVFCRYALSAVNAAYALVSLCVLGALALVIAPRLSLTMGAIAVPAWLALRVVYAKQSELARRAAQARQDFTADLTERLTGLFQIKASAETAAHRAAALRRQDEMTRLDKRLSYTLGFLMAFNPILLAVALGALYARAWWLGEPLGGQLALLGPVGMLGFRAVTQLNYMVGALGNVTRLSGGTAPVLRILALAPEPPRKPLPEPLREIRVEEASYSYGPKTVLERRTLRIAAGKVFLIMGPSGSGKTTLANLLAGLVPPSSGRIVFVGASGAGYDGAEFKPRIGYVTQDVHLFRGTARENLDPAGRAGDAALLDALERAGARRFIDAIGGLDAEIAEAGRSLSGGERRRMAIAQALAQGSDALILDEVTNGLDEAAKGSLLRTIAGLAQDVLVIMISHDPSLPAAFDNSLLVMEARA